MDREEARKTNSRQVRRGIDLFNGKYRARITINGKPYSQYSDTREEAEAFLYSLKAKKKNIRFGAEPQFESITFRDFVARYMSTRYQEWSANTISSYNGIISNVIEEFGQISMHAIDASDIREHLHKLKNKGDWEASTFNRHHAFLKQIWNAAIDQRPIKHAFHNPLDQIKTLVEPYKPRTIFSNAVEMEDFLSNAWEKVNPTYWIGVTVMLNTGLRTGEALAIRNGDIKLSHSEKCGQIHIRNAKNTKTGEIQSTKTKHHRVVPFGVHLYEGIMFWRQYDCMSKADDYLVRFPRIGRGMSGSHFAKLHREYIKEMNYTQVTLHGLRHCFATHTLAKTNSLLGVKELMGHVSYQTTLRYVQTLRETVGRDFGLSVGGRRPILKTPGGKRTVIRQIYY